MEYYGQARYIISRKLNNESDYIDLIIELEALYDMAQDSEEKGKIMEIIVAVSITKDEL